MRLNSRFLLLLLTLGATYGGLETRTAFAESSHPVIREELDQRVIHNLYSNSEFETVIDVLERFQKNNPNCSFSDSVFLAKHLAVIYCANSATRERGRFYMIRLLELVPNANLVDMFVSEEIDKIFEKARKEVFAKQHGFGLDSLTISISENSGSSKQVPVDTESHSHKTLGWNRPRTWVIGGLATAMLGTVAYLYFYYPKSSGEVPELVIPKGSGK